MSTAVRDGVYGYTKEVPYTYEQAIDRITEVLADEGFGILSEIDVQAKLREKLGVEDFDRYVILGACNPRLAYQALQEEQELGLLLPCNVIVYRHQDRTYVSVLNPLKALGLVGNDALQPIARQADEHLRRALENA